MKFDRSKFKRANIDETKKMMKEAEETVARPSKGWIQFASIEEGKNIFRVLPSIGGVVYAPLKVSKLNVEVPVYNENGEKTGTEVKSKNIFCADIHGKKLLKGKDPIITYINYVLKRADEEYQDANEKKKFLAPIYGYRNKKGDFVWGIKPTLSYVCYVLTQDEEIKKLQLRPQWMSKMNQISIDATEDSAINLDIFSDPNEGQPLCINMIKIDKPSKNKKYDYDVTAISPKRGQIWEDFVEENRVSDQILSELEQLPTLQELYVDSYSKKDFDWAIDGLKRLDETANYDIFQDDAFLDEIEQMAATIPEDDSSEETEEKPSKKEIKKESTKSSYPSPSKMKAQLISYIEDNYDAGTELPDLSLSELKHWYDLMQDEKELPFEDYEEEEENNDNETYEETADDNEESENEPSPLKEEVEESKLTSARSRIADIKNRFKRK